MPRPVSLPDDTIVIRFPPATASGVLKRARLAAAAGHGHVASVFAALPRDGESEQQVIDRLVETAGLSGINLERNRKVYVCTRAGKITGAGLTFVKDGYDGEVPEHYSVDLGDQATEEDAQRFLGTFDEGRRLQ